MNRSGKRDLLCNGCRAESTTCGCVLSLTPHSRRVHDRRCTVVLGRAE